MIMPSGYSLSKMYSELSGLQVNFATKPKATPSKAKVIFGVYSELPEEGTIVIRAELPMLASMGGALVGLPNSLVSGRIGDAVLDETLRDAMHEVLNVTSTLLSTQHRVVFKTMYTDAAHLCGPARSIVNAPILATSFDVAIQGYSGGELSIFADL